MATHGPTRSVLCTFRRRRAATIHHNAGDYTHSRRSASQATVAASCGGYAYNLHYGLRPAFSAGCAAIPGGSATALSGGTYLSHVHLCQSAQQGSRPDGLRLKAVNARPAASVCGGSCRAIKQRVTRSRLASFRYCSWRYWWRHNKRRNVESCRRGCF